MKELLTFNKWERRLSVHNASLQSLTYDSCLSHCIAVNCPW